MADPDLEQAVLGVVRHPDYRPLKPRAIARKLGLDEDEARALKRAIKRLVKKGLVAYGANHMVATPPTGGDNYRVTGIFRRHDAGFGFVRPAGSAPGADRQHDIFIDAKDSRDASTGDTVLVRMKKKQQTRRPNPEGVVVEVIERQTHRFVGTYFEVAGTAYVQIDGKLFTQPLLLGDPGAKNAQPDDKIVIEMIRFPSPNQEGQGVIAEVLGPRGTPGV